MRKTIFALLSIAPLMLSCGGGASSTASTPKEGVIGKSFLYNSCIREEAKTGTSADFYAAHNPAGSNKDAVLSSVVDALYDDGTSEGGSALYFSDIGDNSYLYNGQMITSYEYNHTKIDDTVSSFGGYYIALDEDFSSIKFVETSSGSFELQDKVFRSAQHAESEGEAIYVYETTFVATSATYDGTSKKLTIGVDVTYTAREDSESSYVMSYSLSFAKK